MKWRSLRFRFGNKFYDKTLKLNTKADLLSFIFLHATLPFKRQVALRAFGMQLGLGRDKVL